MKTSFHFDTTVNNTDLTRRNLLTVRHGSCNEWLRQ